MLVAFVLFYIDLFDCAKHLSASGFFNSLSEGGGFCLGLAFLYTLVKK